MLCEWLFSFLPLPVCPSKNSPRTLHELCLFHVFVVLTWKIIHFQSIPKRIHGIARVMYIRNMIKISLREKFIPCLLSQLYTNWIFCDEKLQKNRQTQPQFCHREGNFSLSLLDDPTSTSFEASLVSWGGKGKACRVVCLWKTGQKTKVTQIQGQSNLISFLPLVAEKSPLWSVAPETQMRVASAKWDVIIAFRDHGNTRMKRSRRFRLWGVCMCAIVCVCVCVCTSAWAP